MTEQSWIKKRKWHLVGIIICYLAFQLIFIYGASPLRYFSFIFIFIGLCVLAYIIPEKKVYRPLKYFIFAIISVPINIVHFIGLISPLIEALFISFIALTIGFSISYYTFSILPEILIGIKLNLPTLIYTTITLGIIIIYFLGESLVKWIWLFFYSHKIFKKEFKAQLAKKRLLLRDINDIKRLRFLIFLLFFIFLIVFSILNLNESSWLLSKDIFKAISYAFVTFIAFDRIMGNIQLMKINLAQLIYTLGKFDRSGVEVEEKYYRLKQRERNKNRNT